MGNATVQNIEETTFPTALKTVEETSAAIKYLVSVDRLLELAEAGYLPCWRIEDRYMFQVPDVRRWLAKNFMQHNPGRPFPNVIEVPVVPASGMGPVPSQLSLFSKHLASYVHWRIPTCVYFLSMDGVVVYVGKSVSLSVRISAHISEKEKQFNGVFYLPVPESDLLRTESAFIESLKPKYNYGSNGKLVYPCIERGEEILETFYNEGEQ